MTEQTEKRREKASSELEKVLEQLTSDQILFVIARQDFDTDKEAAESRNMRPNLIYNWKYKGVPIDEAVRLFAADGLVTALHIRRRALGKAMAVKVAGLDSENEPVRQKSATEIIEWEMGKATQPTDNKHDGDIAVRFFGGFDNNASDSS